MEQALIGLLGVIVGSALATLKDWWINHYKTKSEGRHLCLLTAFALERYVQRCAEVAMDSGEEDKEGYTHVTTSTPQFDPGAIAGDWRTIPVTLTNEIFDLQLSAEATDRIISNEFEFAACPPEYAEGFEERQYGYAVLGLRAFQISNSLRKHAGIATRASKEWPIGKMRKLKEETEAMRRDREREHANSDA